jgi:GST-like protein
LLAHWQSSRVILTESDAILLYLADKAGRLVPPSGRARTRATELLFLQASLQGPMFGQRMHFSVFSNDTIPYGIRRYEEQGEIIDVLVDRLLEGSSFAFHLWPRRVHPGAWRVPGGDRSEGERGF